MEKRKKRPVEKQNKVSGKAAGSRPAPEKREAEEKVGRQTQTRRLFSRLYTAGAVVVVTAALVWAFTAFFTVENIAVYGNSRYTAEEIIGFSGLEKGSGLILLSKSRIRDRIIENSVYIEDVSVKRVLPDTVEITVTDKTVAAAFETNGAYWLISGSGALLELTLELPRDVTVIKGVKLVDSAVGRNYTCEDGVKQTMLGSLLEGLRENSLLEHVVSVDMTETYQVVLNYADTFDIVMGSAERIASDCARIPKVIGLAESEGKTSGCFDMRDGTVRYTPDRWDANILG